MTAGGAPEAVVHTVLSVLRGAEGWLERRGVDAPRRSAELLLGHVLRLSRLQLYLAHDRPLDAAERAAMRALLARRGEHEPVAYLLGSWSFRGLELTVSPAVLVPRPETEQLVGLALERAADARTAIDLGTGSGAIAIALAVERPGLRVTGVDASHNALAVAVANAARHGVTDRVQLLHGSWWEPAAAATAGPFDLAVANPPYVDPRAGAPLAADVRAFEPPLALFTAPGDVLSCYRPIVAGLERHLAPGGTFAAETGVGASDPLLELARAAPFLIDVALLPDDAGIARFLLARRR